VLLVKEDGQIEEIGGICSAHQTHEQFIQSCRKTCTTADVDGTTLLKWIVNKWGGMLETGLLWIRIGQTADYCERGNYDVMSENGVVTLCSANVLWP
jgi:hypothetical protein